MSPRGKAEVCAEDLFGRAKTRGRGQVTMKKKKIIKKGITIPLSDGGVKKLGHY